MSELVKKQYKISLWEEEQIYLIKRAGAPDSERYETSSLPDGDYEVLNKYTKENCLAVIGSDTMDTPIRAFEPKLVRQTNGTNTLTFQVFYRYYDEDEETFKLNPFTNLLVNERKVKLFYDGEWLDFVIKQIQEDSQKQIFTYTCQDLYICELSKNGYGLVFDTELQNNIGTVTELAETILEGTDWRVDADGSDSLIQTKGEALFTYEVESPLKARVMENFEYGFENWKRGQEVTIPKKAIIFICYSSYTNQENTKIQFFYREQGDYKTDDDNNIINSPNFEADAPENLWDEDISLKITSDYRGKYLVETIPTEYIPQIEKFCYKYLKDGKNYYAYVSSKFTSFDSTSNLITNCADFTSTTGWYGVNDSSVELSSLTPVDEDKVKSTIRIDFKSSGKVGNSGVHDSKALLEDYQGFTFGDRYILAVKTENNGYITGGSITYSSKDTSEKEIFSCTLENKTYDGLTGYKIYALSCIESISYQDIVLGNLNFYLLGENTVLLEDIKLFKEVVAEIEGKPHLIIPDLESIIYDALEDWYYFFEANKLTNEVRSVKDIAFDTIYKKEDISKNGYVLAEEPTYEKRTSITASKSNRFNLIQDLCEAFECWARFNIEHDSYGAIVCEYVKTEDFSRIDGKKYYTKIDVNGDNSDFNFKYYTNSSLENSYERILHKEVCFKEYIGDENYAGFRYGINLQSISRSLDTKQIVTKLIVEANSNEFGQDGFCTIQRASMNPTGDNIIYNFQYYLNNGLINKEELHTDFYDEAKGIGLYTKLNRYNKENTPIILRQAEISTTLAKAIAKQEIYTSIIEESTKKRQQYIQNIKDAFTKLEADTGQTVPDEPATVNVDEEKYSSVINENIRQRNNMTLTIQRYDPLKKNMDELVSGYQEQYDEIALVLSQNNEKMVQLNNEFFKKYSRFVQEGTWISEDYYDDNLYYLDACKVGRTSAFPQVTYTINVLELSGLEEYKNYNFKVGDKTYVEDVEFFGYVPETKSPYREEVIVSEITYNLDNPASNTIKVQNYKTQFEDLFQRITATTQSLQYHEGKYGKAADIVNEDGTINGSVLEKTLKFNYYLSDAISKEISEGGEVINLTSVTNPNRYVRLSGLGIQLSNDGGLNWQTAITADGINADVGVFGALHTNSIRIYNGDKENFVWDARGLTSYASGPTGAILVNKFVRMDEHGIYGYVGNTNETFYPNTLEEVVGKSIFSLTWDGLHLRSINGSNFVEISARHNNENAAIIQVGQEERVDGEVISTTPRFTVYENGDVHIAGTANINGDTHIDGHTYIGGDTDISGNLYLLDDNSKNGNLHLSGTLCVHKIGEPNYHHYGRLGYVTGDRSGIETDGIGVYTLVGTAVVATDEGARLSAFEGSTTTQIVATLPKGDGKDFGRAVMSHTSASSIGASLRMETQNRQDCIFYRTDVSREIDGFSIQEAEEGMGWRRLEYAYFA